MPSPLHTVPVWSYPVLVPVHLCPRASPHSTQPCTLCPKPECALKSGTRKRCRPFRSRANSRPQLQHVMRHPTSCDESFALACSPCHQL
eukprot:10287941-Alexandrium_andersonii.AAC.1